MINPVVAIYVAIYIHLLKAIMICMFGAIVWVAVFPGWRMTDVYGLKKPSTEDSREMWVRYLFDLLFIFTAPVGLTVVGMICAYIFLRQINY